MTIRPALVPWLLFAAALNICGQEAGGFPPSRSWRSQLAERGPLQDISLRDALALALMHNPEIEIETYGRDLSSAATLNARSFFDPQAALTTSILSANQPVTNILQTGEFDSQITKSWTVAPSIQDNLPGGGTAALSMNLVRTSTNGLYVFINPVYTSTVGLTVMQPLWRGFRRTANERDIVISRLNQQMTESQFRQKVASTVEQVIETYWRLAVVTENYEAQRQARDVAVLEYEDARKSEEDAAALTAKRSEVASHDQNLTQAEIQIVQASNNLKRLLTSGIFDPLWRFGLIATDRPAVEPPSLTLEDAVKTALDRRPEIEQLHLQVRQSDAELRFARQETKPTVNLRLEIQSVGDAGRVYGFNADGSVSTAPDLASPAYGGLGKSITQTFGIQHPSAAAALDIKLPLGNRAANSQLTTAEVGSHKLQSQFRAAQEDIMMEVRTAWETIAAQRNNVAAAAIARRLAEEHLAADAAKSGNDVQSLDIPRDQRDLADARVHELQAQIDFELAEVALEKATDTLVDDHQIVLARQQTTKENAGKP